MRCRSVVDPLSIRCHREVNLPRPGVDAAREVVHVAIALPAQKHRHVGAATAVVADAHDRLLGRKFWVARWHLAHRHQFRPLDLTDLYFPGLAHVEQHGPGTLRIRQPVRQFRGRERLQCGQTVRLTSFTRIIVQNLKRDGRNALRSGLATVSNRCSVS